VTQTLHTSLSDRPVQSTSPGSIQHAAVITGTIYSQTLITWAMNLSLRRLSTLSPAQSQWKTKTGVLLTTLCVFVDLPQFIV